MKKKVLSVLLVAAMAMSMLTGCGSKPAGNDAQSAASSEASKETEAAAETTCFRRRRDTDCMVLGS